MGSGDIFVGKERKETREEMFGGILWSFAGLSARPVFMGSIIDLSKSGISIRTQTRFAEGDRLTIDIDGFWDGVRCAEVRWIKQVEPGIYRSGLRFMDNC